MAHDELQLAAVTNCDFRDARLKEILAIAKTVVNLEVR